MVLLVAGMLTIDQNAEIGTHNLEQHDGSADVYHRSRRETSNSRDGDLHFLFAIVLPSGVLASGCRFGGGAGCARS